jgi:hypothetical protein
MKHMITILLVSTATNAEPWYRTSLLVAAETSLAIDMMQTLDIRHHPTYGPEYAGPTTPPYNLHEINPILGAHPSDAKIVVYFAATSLLTAGSYYALPPRWRPLVPLAVLILEIPMIAHNAKFGLTLRL